MKHTQSIFHYSILPLVLLYGTALSQPVRVSVRSAIASAMQNHGSVRIAGERVTAAEARYDEAGARLLPSLQLTGRAFLLSDVERGALTLPFGSFPLSSLFPVVTHSYAARLQLTQPVFNGFRLREAKDVAEYGVEAATADMQRDEADLALDVQTAYWTWVQAREAQRVMEETALQMKEHEQRVMNMANKGLTTNSDVLTIRTKRSDVEVRAIEMRSRASMAMMRLNFLMGSPLDMELAPEDTPDDIRLDAVSTDDQALVARAVDARPDLASARLRTKMATSAVSISSGGAYPSIAFAAAYEYSNPNQRYVPPADEFKGTWEVGLTFQWTVWDWMIGPSKTAEAEASKRQAEEGYELMLKGVQLEIAQLTRQVADNRDRLASARLAVDAARESFRIMDEQFGKGLATSLDVTDSRIEVLRAELAYTQVASESAVTQAKLRRAIGASYE